MIGRTNSFGGTVEKYNVKAWADTIGLNYYKLDEITNSDMAALMSMHVSCDFLIEWYNKKPEMIDDFITCELAMKWIGLRDYICDKLMAIPEVKDKMLASEYWEYILKDKVPVMTSNTTPSGVASSSSIYATGHEAYRAFDTTELPTDGDCWSSSNGGGAGGWIQYKFTNPICVNRVHSLYWRADGYYNSENKHIVQASNDGSTWVALTGELSFESTGESGKYTLDANIDNNKYYVYYRFYCVSPTYSTAIDQIDTLQFYGRSLNISVPNMTSTTKPYGEVISTGTYSTDNPNYKAFGGTGYFSSSATTGGIYIGYKFKSPVNIKKVKVINQHGDGASHYTESYIQYSDDNITWVNCSENIVTNAGKSMFVDINSGNHQYWRWYIVSIAQKSYGIASLNFYGVDYSENPLSEITMTVEGAKGDNITITDESGEIVGNIIFDTDAVSKEYTMNILDGAEYTFTSSVAKDTTDISNNYSKKIILTNNSTDIKVIPNNILYWYGNNNIYSYSLTAGSGSLTNNNQSMTINNTSYATITEQNKIDFDNTNQKIHLQYKGGPFRILQASNRNSTVYTNFPALANGLNVESLNSSEITNKIISSDSCVSGSYYIALLGDSSNSNFTIYSLWIE